MTGPWHIKTNMKATMGFLTSTGMTLWALPLLLAGQNAHGFTISTAAISGERS
jgi:hypothetical protein